VESQARIPFNPLKATLTTEVDSRRNSEHNEFHNIMKARVLILALALSAANCLLVAQDGNPPGEERRPPPRDGGRPGETELLTDAQKQLRHQHFGHRRQRRRVYQSPNLRTARRHHFHY
jgi:hypothetical protein